VWVEPAGEKHARRLEDLIHPTQMRNLAAQLLDLLALLTGEEVLALALVSFRAPHVFTQCLRVQRRACYLALAINMDGEREE
jgi:hypothetical protein